MRRIAPALGLFLVAPLVAEFLLGNLPITLIGALVVLAPFYGGGALLIREAVRRTRRGWPGILVLGLAYAVFEEAFTTQSLFNPDYLRLNLHLLDPAYVPALGIGAWWTMFVLTLHTVWSIATSIALVEALVPARATTPWLGKPGLAIAAILFALGAAASTAFALRSDPYVAPMPQLAGAGIVLLVLILIAFRLPVRRAATAAGGVPSPWLVAAVALAAGSAFLVVPNSWGWGAVAVYVVLDVAVIGAVHVWSRRTAWDGRHRLALAAGAALAYAWHAFPQHPAVGGSGTADLVGNAIFAAAALVLIALAARRQVRFAAQSSLPLD
jgi:hypothetical protein